MNLDYFTQRLELRHAWTIARGTAVYKEYNFVRLEQDGIVAWGEAAHNERYGESLESIAAFIEDARPLIEGCEPTHFYRVGAQLAALPGGQQAARAGLDIALLDWAGKAMGVPLYRLWGLDRGQVPLTSFSIGIDAPESIAAKIAEAEDFPILKIKLGSDQDETIMAAVRDATDKVVRVDANEGWTEREQALERIEWLAGLGVEFVEQPLPAGRLADMAWLRQRSPLPLVADEDVKTAADIPALAAGYDGINIKVMKAGGLQESLRMIYLAKTMGLKIMLGCMIESSVGISAAAQLAPLVDWADLDGNLLLRYDPYRGTGVDQGRLVLSDRPGIGVRKAD